MISFLRFCLYGLLLAVLQIYCSCSSDKTTTQTPAQHFIDTTALNIEAVPSPPKIIIDYDTTAWLDIAHLDRSIILDIRYATTNNFVEEKMYDCPRCFLRPQLANKIVEAHHILRKRNLGLKLFDCYRPRPVQQKLWDKVPNASYVTPPSKGSMHNRGGAVDLTIVDLNGKELDMGTGYDYFGVEAHHTYKGHTEEIHKNRTLLLELMEEMGLKGIRTEWWHYSLPGYKFPISDWLWPCNETRLPQKE